MRKACLRFLTFFLCCCLFFTLAAPLQAAAFPVRRPAPDQENDPNDPAAAQNISGTGLVTELQGFYSPDFLFNQRKVTGLTSDDNVSMIEDRYFIDTLLGKKEPFATIADGFADLKLVASVVTSSENNGIVVKL